MLRLVLVFFLGFVIGIMLKFIAALLGVTVGGMWKIVLVFLLGLIVGFVLCMLAMGNPFRGLGWP